MFVFQMREKNKKLVEIKGIRSDIFQLIVDYVYSGTAKLNDDTVFDTMAASDYLVMNGMVKNRDTSSLTRLTFHMRFFDRKFTFYKFLSFYRQ